MFEYLFGNSTINKVLLFLARFEEGYPREIAQNFDISISMVQLQMDKLERGGIFVSQLKGRTRIYSWNPRYPFKNALLALLHKGLGALRDNEIKRYYTKRKRPRRRGKPL